MDSIPSPRNGQVQSLAAALSRLILAGDNFRNLRARELHLGTSDLVALDHLFAGGPMAPKDLSTLLGVTSGTMTALLDRVEKAGFLKREHDPEDRRALLIHLTPAGAHAMQWLAAEFDRAIRQTLADIPELTSEQLRTGLTGLSHALESNSIAAESSPQASSGT